LVREVVKYDKEEDNPYIRSNSAFLKRYNWISSTQKTQQNSCPFLNVEELKTNNKIWVREKTVGCCIAAECCILMNKNFVKISERRRNRNLCRNLTLNPPYFKHAIVASVDIERSFTVCKLLLRQKSHKSE
jgi:hypothetical protein